MQRIASRRTAIGAAALLAQFHAGAALAAGTLSVAYSPEDTSVVNAYVVDWKPKSRAFVTEAFVAGGGSYTDDGTQRLVTFDGAGMPAYDLTAYDCNGLPFQQLVEITQMVFRPVSGTLRKGTSQVVEIGYTVDEGGCTPGLKTPFGSPTDPGLSTSNLDMANRASIADLVPGAQLAGPSEDPPPASGFFYDLTEQVTTFGNGTLTFDGTGHTWPESVVNGWIVLDFGTFQRAYTRLTRNAKTGVETWLAGGWQGGAPMNVQNVVLAEPNALAGFGGRKGAAHDWDNGLFMKSGTITEYDLYRDFTGLRIFNGDVGNGQPVTWALKGANLVVTRVTSTYKLIRTWAPFADYGKNHFVIENEDRYDLSGQYIGPNVIPRVNWYVDEGKSTEPAGTPASPDSLR